jgi:hypothetical protein
MVLGTIRMPSRGQAKADDARTLQAGFTCGAYLERRPTEGPIAPSTFTLNHCGIWE